MNYFESINPTNGKIIKEYLALSEDELNEILLNTDKRFDSWKKNSVDERSTYFLEIAEIIDQKKNEYFSNNLVQFMCESLTSLNSEYNKKKSRLNLFEGDIIDVLDEIKKTNNINSVGFNADYSPYSKKRDNNIKNLSLIHI